MTPPLYMVRVPLRLSDLARYAGDRGWTKRHRKDGREADASFDAGRALHHVLDETFGPGALKPFRLMVPRDRDRGSVYAYSPHPKDALLATAVETSPPESRRILALDNLDVREMPLSWTVGRRLAFDVRVRPVVRIKSKLANPRPGLKDYDPGSEVDAFLAEAQRQHADTRPRLVDGEFTASGMSAEGRTREVVYRDWLAMRLTGAAAIDPETTTMAGFQRLRVARAGRSVEGPDATFHGELIVTDSERFRDLLTRGVGRHRSFGFGMLLLRPARRR